jgi:hypothetical protein
VVRDGPGQGGVCNATQASPGTRRHPPADLHGHEHEERALVTAALDRGHRDDRRRLREQGGRGHERSLRPPVGRRGEQRAEDEEAAEPDREGFETARALQGRGDPDQQPDEETRQAQAAWSVRLGGHGCRKGTPSGPRAEYAESCRRTLGPAADVPPAEAA